jgi:hypothetical protein
MTRKDKLEGWGLSSEQYDEDQLLEVDNRSVEYDELREQAKNPKATWSEDADEDAVPDREDGDR